MTKKNPIYGQGSYESQNQEVQTSDPWHERYKYGPHYRRGPKNTDVRPSGRKHSDDKIWEALCDALANAYDVNATDMEVEVQSSVVYLLGVVHTHKEAWRAEEIAWEISGVESVKNNIEIIQSL
jgi:hypothetical protein